MKHERQCHKNSRKRYVLLTFTPGMDIRYIYIFLTFSKTHFMLFMVSVVKNRLEKELAQIKDMFTYMDLFKRSDQEFISFF